MAENCVKNTEQINRPLIKVEPPPAFSGGLSQSFRQWQAHINLYCQITGMTDQIKANFIGLSLKDGPLKVFQDLSSEVRQSPIKILEKLQDAFGEKNYKNIHFRRLQNCVQGPAEIFDYYERLLKIFNFTDISPDYQIFYFINGLEPKIKEAMATNSCKTLEQALHQAMTIQTCTTVDNTSSNTVETSPPLELKIFGTTNTVLAGEWRVCRAELPITETEFAQVGLISVAKDTDLEVISRLINTCGRSLRFVVFNRSGQPLKIEALRGNIHFQKLNEAALLSYLANQ